MKSRLRADLIAAMKLGRKREATALRQLIAAIDNAEAVPLRANETPVRHEFLSGTAEVERLFLGKDQVRAILLREIEDRAEAAAEFERLGLAERAEVLKLEMLVARRYLDDESSPLAAGPYVAA